MENNELQRTDNWYNDRRGKFTASEIYKLCISGKRDMTDEELKIEKSNKGKRKTVDTMFGDMALNYIKKKATEYLISEQMFPIYCEENQLYSRHILRGVELEPEAKQVYTDKTGYIINDAGFIGYNEYSGSSPDGLIIDSNGGVEVKCPDIENHIQFLLMKDGNELKTTTTSGMKYWNQCQFVMLTCNLKWIDFLSYNNYFSDLLCMGIIRIYPDTEWQNDIKLRISEAGKLRDNYIDEIINNQIVLKNNLKLK